MKEIIKNIVAHTYQPLLTKYLSKERRYHYKNIYLDIPPGVFHPGFFFSTKLLLNYIAGIDLNEKQFLELGCGSGLISISAAKSGAYVTATDINPLVIESLIDNSRMNRVELKPYLSDLFKSIPEKKYDIIAINPPYYKKQPVIPADYAWYCGENGEYFSELFDDLSEYLLPDSIVLMVLSDNCDMNMISLYAEKNGFTMDCVFTKKNFLEKDFIYKIVRK